MRRVTKLACMLALATLPSAIAKTATAQDVVTTYYPPQATVTYLPVQRGLFGQRISYQPVVGIAPATTVTSYAQAPRVIAGDPVPSPPRPAQLIMLRQHLSRRLIMRRPP